MLTMTLLGLTAATVPPAEASASFSAAGFVRHGTEWRTRDCEGMEGASYSPGRIEEYRDINGDGRPEAIVNEGSAICYGMTGMHFWLMSKQANGTWRLIHRATAMPAFLTAKGASGWPEIELGGPGFCFPVLRWNGRAYAHHRYQYEGKPCRPPAH